MIYLTCTSATDSNLQLLRRPDVGVMLTPQTSWSLEIGEKWAADNGCYSQGENFDLDTYLAWLSRMKFATSSCLFAVAPDVVGNALATWERSRHVLPVMRSMGYKVALVAQDGLEGMNIEWDAFDCLFIGGTTEWKLSEVSYSIALEGSKRGKWIHMGRVNSFRRFRAAKVSGMDSCDGTFMAFGPDKNLNKIISWLDAPLMVA